MARSAKFDVFCKLDSASVPQRGKVIVERDTNTVTVRRKGARKTWTFTLDSMVQLCVEKAIFAEVLKKRLEKANAVKEKKRQAREIRRIKYGK